MQEAEMYMPEYIKLEERQAVFKLETIVKSSKTQEEMPIELVVDMTLLIDDIHQIGDNIKLFDIKV